MFNHHKFFRPVKHESDGGITSSEADDGETESSKVDAYEDEVPV